MKFRYVPGTASVPLPSLGGSRQRHRPILSVRVTGPAQFVVRDGLLDTGSDDTVFPEGLAAILGVDLTQAQVLSIHLAGRGVISCRYAQVMLHATDALTEAYEWPATVGFVPGPMKYALLGHAGFLHFFDAEFRGADREVVLTANPSFPGRRILLTLGNP